MANYPLVSSISRSPVLLTCHDAGGTIPPVLAVAEALIARGNEVVILSQPSVTTARRSRGMHVRRLFADR